MTDELLDCGRCHGCCHQVVMILPDDGPGPWRLDPAVPHPVLERRADGSCVYLDGVIGCMIYERRPAVCRTFHCGTWWLTLSADERRSLALGGAAEREMLSSGARHAHGLSRAEPVCSPLALLRSV